jgi:PTH1 family peptidyl-tRNA hydrolase
MFLHVGLGNPGKEYELHRHNVGFMAIDSIINKYDIKTGKEKFNGYYYTFSKDNEKIILLKPQTFMNDSGRCVTSIMDYFSIEPSSVIVWHDEIDLDKGKIKVKFGGGHGGHNGIRDIINHIGENFYRVRIGIGRPIHNISPSKWVLSPFYRDDFNNWLNDLLIIMANETDYIYKDKVVEFMNRVAINTNNNEKKI